MRRTRGTFISIAVAGTLSVAGFGQDWQPVNRHAARYAPSESSTLSLLGKPIAGSRASVDRQVEPARYTPGDNLSLPLPLAPAGQPIVYEGLPYPGVVTIQPGKNQLQSAPMPPMHPSSQGTTAPQPPAGQPRAEQIQALPSPSGVIMSGPVMYGQPLHGQAGPGVVLHEGTFMPGGFCGDGMCGVAGSDRYYLSAPHGAPGCWYGSLEFLLWTISSDKTPPLVSTGPQGSNGILGQDGVSILYGGSIDTDALSGGRVNMGVWFNRCQTWGMFGSFFTTGTRTTNFSAESAGDPLLARPFFNIDAGAEDSELVARSELLSGRVDVEHNTQLTGADLNFRFNWWNKRSCTGRLQWHLDSYAGVKYVSLNEDLKITENLEAGPQSTAPGALFLVRDRFSTDNDFIGGNIGLMSELRLGRFFLGMRSGVGIGGTNQTVVIKGTTTFTPVGGTAVTQTGGLLALPTNIGTYHRNVFSVVPEFGINLGLNVTDHLRVFVGYDVMYWTNVARPGQQIDRVVNPTQLPTINGPGTLVGPARPAFNFVNSNVYIQGLSAGLQWTF